MRLPCASVLGGFAALALACRPSPPPPPGPLTPSPSPKGERSRGARPRAVIDSPSGRRTAVEVELARTREERARGLMFRERLAPMSGMLFVFEENRDHAFWMKDTPIPLDMIFIDQGGAVVGVVERAEPFSLDPRAAGVPSRYVLEVAGGFAAEHGVRPGDRVRFEGLP